jgi:hypothetical protein
VARLQGPNQCTAASASLLDNASQAFSLMGHLARLGWPRIGSPGIFRMQTR